MKIIYCTFVSKLVDINVCTQNNTSSPLTPAFFISDI